MTDSDFQVYRAAGKTAADLLARMLPAQKDWAERYLPTVFAALEEGHTYIAVGKDEALQLAKQQPLVGNGEDNAPLVLQGNRLFLGRMWQLEQRLAAEIVRLAKSQAAAVDSLAVARHLKDWFGAAGSEGQRDAVALACLKPFLLVGGGPGTGKTTTVAKLLAVLCSGAKHFPRIALAAPTGKAAAHMAASLRRALDTFEMSEEVKGYLGALQGQTVHRLLRLEPPLMRPRFRHGNPLPVDILIVDEASMLDTALMLQLLQAVADGCRVVLLGDDNQLPPVGAGAVLSAFPQQTLLDVQTASDLSLLSERHGFAVAENPPVLAQNVARLSVSHRFGSNSGIGCLARAVAAGDGGGVVQAFGQFPDEVALAEGGVREQAERFYAGRQAYWQAVEAGDAAQAYAQLADTAVLAARRADAQAFNREYLRLLHRQGKTGGREVFPGLAVMITRNHPSLSLYNGDIGLVMKDGVSDGMTACFPDAQGFRKLPLSRLGEYETAFAITVHKSQGSEYREVWLAVSDLPSETADRALLYTAVTRARERFVFWGRAEQAVAAAENAKQRRTALPDIIARLWQCR